MDNSIFNQENPAMRFLTAIANLIIVNLIFIITCIPIFTIGASLSALYRICHEIHLGNHPTVFKEYFAEFKSSFKNSTIIWIPTFLALCFLIADLYVINNLIDAKYVALQIPVFILLFFVVSIIFYAFPMQATLNQTIKTTVKNALIFGFAKLPTTIFILVIYAFLYLLIDFNAAFGVYIFSFSLFMGCALMCWFCGFFIDRILGIDKKSLAEANAKQETSKSSDSDEISEETEETDISTDISDSEEN